jgi:glycosyltransferase involved in cell wall biosynthesis
MLISVYLPTKDRHAQLRAAVDSVLNQTHRELELIVVDDGSTDATPDYLRGLQASDGRVRVLRHDRARGAPASRNAAVAMARGEWVTGLDDDDEFLPERLARLSAYASFFADTGQRFCGVYAQDYVRISDEQRVRSQKRGPVQFEELFASNVIGNQILVRRSVYQEAGGFDERLPAWQDLDFLLRITRQFGPAQLLDVPLYVFDNRPRPDRISTQKKQGLLDSYRLVAGKYPELPVKLRQLLYLQVFSRCYGIPMNAGDIYRFFRLGFHPSTALRLAKLVAGRDGSAAVGPPLAGGRGTGA